MENNILSKDVDRIVYKNAGLEFDVTLEGKDTKDLIKVLDKLMSVHPPVKEEKHECKCNHDKEVKVTLPEKATFPFNKGDKFKNVTPPKVMKPANNRDSRKSKLPPIWIVECPDCGDFVCLNTTKLNNMMFECAKCGCKTKLYDDNVALASFNCECGTYHTVAVHSLSNVVSTKCRSCAMPIDLKWNEKRERYEKL